MFAAVGCSRFGALPASAVSKVQHRASARSAAGSGTSEALKQTQAPALTPTSNLHQTPTLLDGSQAPNGATGHLQGLRGRKGGGDEAKKVAAEALRPGILWGLGVQRVFSVEVRFRDEVALCSCLGFGTGCTLFRRGINTAG